MASDTLRRPENERPPVAEVLPADRAGREPDSLAQGAAATLETTVAAVEGADASIPKEGVYAPPRPRKVLFSELVELRTETLPRRKPRIAGDQSFLAVVGDERGLVRGCRGRHSTDFR
jgi:hypothetical protein